MPSANSVNADNKVNEVKRFLQLSNANWWRAGKIGQACRGTCRNRRKVHWNIIVINQVRLIKANLDQNEFQVHAGIVDNVFQANMLFKK